MQLYEISVRVCRDKPAAHFYSKACSYSLLQSLPGPASTPLQYQVCWESPSAIPLSPCLDQLSSIAFIRTQPNVISLSLVPDHLRGEK